MHVYVSVCVYTLFYKIKKSTKIQIIIRFKFGSKNKKIGFMSNHLYMPSIFFMRVICEDMKEIIYFFMRVMCEDMKEIDSWGIVI